MRVGIGAALVGLVTAVFTSSGWLGVLPGSAARAELAAVLARATQQIGAQINISYEVLAGYLVFLAVLVLRPQGLIYRRTQS